MVSPGAPGPVAVVASRIRREEKAILAELDRREVRYEQVDPRAMAVALTGPRPPWRVALNREIGLHRARYTALSLESKGVRVVNSAAATEICGDKWRTAIALAEAEMPTPRTYLGLTPEAALAAAEELGYPVVLKPLVSSWGRRVSLVRDPDAAAAVAEHCAALPSPQDHLLCVQEYIRKPERDIRVVVVGGDPLGAVYRRSAGWRTNVALGARTEPCPMTDDIAKLAMAAVAATGVEIAGVDLVEDTDGKLYVLEVNSGVEFGGFTSALDVDVPAAIVDHVLALGGGEP